MHPRLRYVLNLALFAAASGACLYWGLGGLALHYFFLAPENDRLYSYGIERVISASPQWAPVLWAALLIGLIVGLVRRVKLGVLVRWGCSGSLVAVLAAILALGAFSHHNIFHNSVAFQGHQYFLSEAGSYYLGTHRDFYVWRCDWLGALCTVEHIEAEGNWVTDWSKAQAKLVVDEAANHLFVIFDNVELLLGPP